MPPITPPLASSTVPPTRRQLDELDALLQRMLELPVHAVEEEPDFREPETDPAATAPSEPIEVTYWNPPPSKLQPEPYAAGATEPLAFHSTSAPLSWNSDEGEADLTAADSSLGIEPYASEFIPEEGPGKEFTDKGSILGDEEYRVPWILGPLLWIDHLYESFAANFGRSGLWLRGPSGRAFLGGLGLVGLGLAGALAILERIGWPH
ncbi:MAG: hypothetical protein ACJ8FY_01440 [Gemmataceae bacterium]